MPDTFHFLQPEWFLALLPLAGLLWLMARGVEAANPWRGVVEPRLMRLLLVESGGRGRWLPLALLGVGGLIAVVALAGPVWEKKTLPVFKRQQALVIVLDLSRSMLTPDLPPSRMERARFKVKSLLRQRREGQTGLVVFAGDAFVVTPLTSDIRTIDAQLRPLSPDLMPAQGSRVDRGLEEAGRLLQQAGMPEGEVLTITDGFHDSRAVEIAKRLRKSGYRVSVLGVGTKEGAPLPDGRGGFVRYDSGKVVTPRLDAPLLRHLAEAGGGRYATITVDDSDLRRLLPDASAGGLNKQMEKSRQEVEQWLERGPWLLPLLLPLAALAFRRGWLLGLMGVALIFPAPDTAHAFGWNDLWKRPDQRAVEALKQGRPEVAERLAPDPLTQGSALYKGGKYQQALKAFSSAQGADAAYNRGNALARLGRYKEAIAAYDEALRLRADMEDARYNRELIEKLLREQEDKKQQQKQTEQQKQDEQKKQGQQQQQQGRQQKEEEQKKPQGGQQEMDGKKQKEQDSEKGNAFEKALKELNKQEDPLQQEQEAETRPGTPEANTPDQQVKAEAESLDSEETAAAEQWLRRIPDDPGGLLRRKFLYQYRQRNGTVVGDEPAW